jgi:hypothetical protein
MLNHNAHSAYAVYRLIVCVCIYILYIYITHMLSIGVELAQTQLVQPDRTNRPSLTHTNPTTIYPSCAPILGFRPFCSTTVAIETVLSLSRRQDPATGPSHRARRCQTAGFFSTLLDTVAPVLLLVIADPVHTTIHMRVDIGSHRVPRP